MNNIEKKDSRGISYFRYIFGNHWVSNRPTYLILAETLTIKKRGSNIADQNINCNYKFVWN